jgi:hypothetical protein
MGNRNKNRNRSGVVVSTKAPDARNVFIAGTFNDWNPCSDPLTRTGDGHWVLTLDLPPGRYEYKFVVDGEWCCEPGCDKAHHGCPGCVPNQFGTMNRVLVVQDTAEQMIRQNQLA